MMLSVDRMLTQIQGPQPPTAAGQADGALPQHGQRVDRRRGQLWSQCAALCRARARSPQLLAQAVRGAGFPA